jgi:hypothetical protein
VSLGVVSALTIFIVVRRLRPMQPQQHAYAVYTPAPRAPRCHPQRRRV